MMNRQAEIDAAVAHYRSLLEAQVKRAEQMETAAQKEDKSRTVIGLCAGDGIGPIIMREAERVLKKLLADELAEGEIELRTIEGLTIENRLEKNQPVPDDVLAAIKECDCLLKGPTTTP